MAPACQQNTENRNKGIIPKKQIETEGAVQGGALAAGCMRGRKQLAEIPAGHVPAGSRTPAAELGPETRKIPVILWGKGVTGESSETLARARQDPDSARQGRKHKAGLSLPPSRCKTGTPTRELGTKDIAGGLGAQDRDSKHRTRVSVLRANPAGRAQSLGWLEATWSKRGADWSRGQGPPQGLVSGSASAALHSWLSVGKFYTPGQLL